MLTDREVYWCDGRMSRINLTQMLTIVCRTKISKKCILKLSSMKREILIKFGNKVRKERAKLGLSQEGLAYKAEVDRTYVTDVENGRRNVSLEILERLIKALNVSFTEFFNSKEFKK